MKVSDPNAKKPAGDGLSAYLRDLLDRDVAAHRNSQVSQLHAIASEMDFNYVEPRPAPESPCWCGHSSDLHRHLDDCKGGDCDCRRFVPSKFPYRQCDGPGCDCTGYWLRKRVPYERPGRYEYGSHRGVSDNPYERDK